MLEEFVATLTFLAVTAVFLVSEPIEAKVFEVLLYTSLPPETVAPAISTLVDVILTLVADFALTSTLPCVLLTFPPAISDIVLLFIFIFLTATLRLPPATSTATLSRVKVSEPFLPCNLLSDFTSILFFVVTFPLILAIEPVSTLDEAVSGL